ncbi:MAG: hypothetical protein GY874_13790 [Desulfobacteraceae bacterium]|nr:hypothetical protein [Desulfobacteraceae bacterium]
MRKSHRRVQEARTLGIPCLVLKRTFEPSFCEGGTTFEKDHQLLFEGFREGLECLDINPGKSATVQDDIARFLNAPEKN